MLMPEPSTQFENNAEDQNLEGLFNGPKYDPDGIGLALSGGGYKAAAYHLGGLIRLNELGLLPKIDRISSVSGGSIAAGYLGLKWNTLTFDAKGVDSDFHSKIVAPLQDFLTNVNIDIPQGILGLLLPFQSAGDRVADAYARKLFGKATLQDLPKAGEGPRFVLLATNYELNSLWRFAQPYAADYRVGRIDLPKFQLARIVAASSAFPPFFCPLKLDLKGHTLVPTPGADRSTGRFAKEAVLCDGGIYDNMGLEPIVKRYGTLLVSNAGNDFEEDEAPTNWASLMLRIISMMHRQAENNRQRPLMILGRAGARKIAYWPLRNDHDNYPVKSPTAVSDADREAAQEEKVRLWSLGEKAFRRLVNHGYQLCDAATRSYLDPTSPPTSKLPF
jgi:NTE family protein